MGTTFRQAPSEKAGSRIVTIDQAIQYRERWHQQGHLVVLTNGCFDILHVGHVRYLRHARRFGRLIVGLNSDRSVSALKGTTRPIVGENDRAEILASLRWVDAVVVFDDATAEPLLQALRPDIYVKGADYGPLGRPLPEVELAARIGTRVELIALVEGRSTTSIVESIRNGAG